MNTKQPELVDPPTSSTTAQTPKLKVIMSKKGKVYVDLESLIDYIEYTLPHDAGYPAMYYAKGQRDGVLILKGKLSRFLGKAVDNWKEAAVLRD